MARNRINYQRKEPNIFRFSTIDWLCILFGVGASIITPLLDHNHSQIYTVISIIMLICGVLEMVLGIRGRRSNYIFAILNTFASIYITWSDQFYGNMAINLYYAPICVYGFYTWGKCQAMILINNLVLSFF